MSKFIKSIILTLSVCSLLFVACSKSVANNTSEKVETLQSIAEDSSDKVESNSENNTEYTSNSSNDNSNKNQNVNFLLNEYDSESIQDTESSENTHSDVKQGLTEEEYYMIIKEAKQRQQEYIDSIDDPKFKQSVQTSYSAAVSESTVLSIKYPEDTDTIKKALNRVLNGE